MTKKAESLYFDSLDTLRTIAFFMVFFSHAIPSKLINKVNFGVDEINSVFYGLFNLGGEGVSVFFVLSGFLITYLLLVEKKKTGEISIFNFYVRRTLRIWPLFYLVVLYALFIYPFIANITGIEHLQNGNTAMNLFFLNNFDLLHLIETDQVGFNQQLQITWSVAIEEQFYLVWPILFILTIRYNILKYVFPALIFLILLFRLNSNDNVNYFHSISAAGDLILGAWIAYLSFSSKWFLNVFMTISNKKRLFVYSVGITLVVFKGLVFDTITFRYFSTFFFAFIILDQCFNKSYKLKLSNQKVMKNMGQYTYGLYLLHPVGILLIKQIMDYCNLSYSENWIFAILLLVFSFCVTYILSFYSYNYFESYFLKLKSKYQKI